MVLFDGLGQLPLPGQRNTYVGAGVNMVRRDLEGLLVVFDRLGQLALPGERNAYVEVGVSIVRLDAQGHLIMLDRLHQLALPNERQAQAELTGRGHGINGNGVAPKSLRVVPDADLVPGESSQAKEEKKGKPTNPEKTPSPRGEQAGTGQERPSQACQVRIAVGGDLGAVLKDP